MITVNLEEQLKDKRNGRSMNAVIRVLLRGIGEDNLGEFYKEGYLEYKNVPGRHCKPSRIRNRIRESLKWLKRNNLLPTQSERK